MFYKKISFISNMNRDQVNLMLHILFEKNYSMYIIILYLLYKSENNKKNKKI